MTTHRLKTTPEYFAAVWSGEKPYEIRWDDRAYQPGHTVVLLEHDPRTPCRCVGPDRTHRAGCERYSGRWIEATIGHVASSTPPRGRQPGFRGNGYVVFALLDLVHSDDEVAGHHSTPAGEAPGEAPSLTDAAAAAPAGPAAAPRERLDALTPALLAGRRRPRLTATAPRRAYTTESGS